MFEAKPATIVPLIFDIDKDTIFGIFIARGG